jgi:membrane fusion protein, multidrug efflux system
MSASARGSLFSSRRHARRRHPPEGAVSQYDEALWPGDFVNASMLVETRRNALVVPGSAVQSGPHGLFTWVVAGNSTVEPRPIEVGPATGDVTIIASGLAEGERIVTAGQYKLQAKAPVVTASLPPPTASGNVR